MKDKTKALIKEIAYFIDKDKYNPFVVTKNYGEYLEKILTELVKGAISFEKEVLEVEK